jgi:hypothetical protein
VRSIFSFSHCTIGKIFGFVYKIKEKQKITFDENFEVVLYIGGIAELFLSSSREEVLFVKRRKGFIKLALKYVILFKFNSN